MRAEDRVRVGDVTDQLGPEVGEVLLTRDLIGQEPTDAVAVLRHEPRDIFLVLRGVRGPGLRQQREDAVEVVAVAGADDAVPRLLVRSGPLGLLDRGAFPGPVVADRVEVEFRLRQRHHLRREVRVEGLELAVGPDHNPQVFNEPLVEGIDLDRAERLQPLDDTLVQ